MVEAARIALVVVVFLSDLLLTGLVFGWAPLLLLLQEEQQYSELCGEDRGEQYEPCVDQENRLNLMFAVASVTMNAASLPVGLILDFCGPKWAVAFAALVEITGLVLMASADSLEFDVFLPAYTMLALGGCITMMASFPASFVLIKYQTAILAAVSCLFDGSSVVFLLLYSLHNAYEFTREQLFTAYAVLAGVVYVMLIVLWQVNEHTLRFDGDDLTARDSSQQQEQRNEYTSLLLLEDARKNGASDKILDNDAMLTYESIKDVKRLAAARRQVIDKYQLVDVALPKQIKTFEFAYIVSFAAIHVLRATLYIGTANKLLENYGDHDHEFLYTKIFSFVLPMGFLFVPAIDHIVEKNGLARSLLFTNALGLGYNVLALIPNLQVQCLTFFVFTAYRAFLYAVMSAFTAKTFGLKNLGSLMGIIFSIGSVTSLLEYPAVYISNAYFDGSLSVMNGISLYLCVMLFPLTEYLRRHEEEREEIQQQLLRQLGGLDRTTAPVDNLNSPSLRLGYVRSPMVRKSRLSYQKHSSDS